MTDILPFLKSMISTSGVSGYETSIAKIIEEKWRPLVDEISMSRVGSLHGLKHGALIGSSKNSGKGKQPSIMIATHMDAIGMMVSKVSDGFLHITNVGGIDMRVLPGAAVTVHASNGEELPGVIAMPSAKLLPESVNSSDVLAIHYLLVDTGLTPREVERKVKVGDLVSFANEPMELADDVISGHTLDNRSS